MGTTLLTHASTSPWTWPTGRTVAGHTIQLLGCGGNGAAGTAGTSGRGGGGGGGGGFYKGTYSSGTITPGTTTIAFVIPAGGGAAATVWQTATNGQTAGGGANRSAPGRGGGGRA